MRRRDELGALGRDPEHPVYCVPVAQRDRERRQEEQRHDRRRKSAEDEYLARLGYEPGGALPAWDSEEE